MYGPRVAAGFSDDSCMATANAMRIPRRVTFSFLPASTMVDAEVVCSALSLTPSNVPPRTAEVAVGVGVVGGVTGHGAVEGAAAGTTGAAADDG